jgi:hypothetical protein
MKTNHLKREVDLTPEKSRILCELATGLIGHRTDTEPRKARNTSMYMQEVNAFRSLVQDCRK